MRSIAALLFILAVPAFRAQDPGLDPACAAGDARACDQAATRLSRDARTRADSARIAAHYLKGCELKSGGACNDYGVALINGAGIPKNPAEGMRAYLRGCELGAPVACRNYGWNLLNGLNGLTKDPANGAKYLERACTADYRNACVELGVAERDGLPGRTPTDGLARLISACDKFHTRGCLMAGYTLRDSVGVPADPAGAAGFFKRACDQNSNETDKVSASDGCSSLGYAYENGQGVPRNVDRAAGLYRRGCDMGAAYSCTGLGLIELRSSPSDTAKATALFGQACDKNQGAGCANLGFILQRGWSGQRPDSVRARRLLQQGCDQNFALGCRWLADAVLFGVGGRPDSVLAFQIHQKACERRVATSCVDLGRAYHYGWAGRPKDEPKALALYDQACTQGNSYGCNNMGVLFSEGPTALRNLARANSLFERECGNGNSKACANLGYNYEYARGVPIDERRAVELYKKSCLANDSYGCSHLKRLAPDSIAILGNLVGSDSTRRGTGVGVSTGDGTGRADTGRGLWALVVGVSRYASKEIRPLTYARKDAEAFAGFLMSPQGGGFQPDRVQLLVDEQVTANALRRGLHTFLRRANQGDLVVIYFAGHGKQPGNAGGIPYFLTHDTDPREMGATAVPMDELRRAVQQSISARYIVAFIDACHSGGVTLATRGADDNEMINRFLRELSRTKETVVTFAASQENQESLEGPEFGGGHGAFTWHLIRGLSGEADRVSEGGDESGTVTIQELSSYVTRTVKTATRNLQEPSLSYLKWDPSLVLSVLRPR